VIAEKLTRTLALNAIPDDRAAIAEMYRVLRPGGRLLLLGHVASHHRVVRGVQRLLEKKSLPIAGDYQTRQPLPIVLATGFTVERQERSKAGVIQRIAAVKPDKQ
jgi:ubiquinone/menaquinone biosynthesis C-methylase UbiE